MNITNHIFTKNNNVYEPNSNKFFAGLAREIRVRAIESFLTLKDVYKFYTHQHEIEWHLKDPILGKQIKFGKFKTPIDVRDWELDLYAKTKTHWSLDKIEDNWFKKIDYIHNWQETKQLNES